MNWEGGARKVESWGRRVEMKEREELQVGYGWNKRVLRICLIVVGCKLVKEGLQGWGGRSYMV